MIVVKLNIHGNDQLTKSKHHLIAQVAIAFKQFDTSGDDKLNYREFCEMIIKREQER